MTVVGSVESLWRYPVKSMRGETLQAAFLGFPGVYGDRILTFRSTAARPGFPFLTGREQEQMILYTASFRRPDLMAQPPNLNEAEALGPGITPIYPDAAELSVDVTTPDGAVLAIDDPRLISLLAGSLPSTDTPLRVTLHRGDRAMTDCRPISLFSVQTARQLGEEVGGDVDQRRFRANIYLDLHAGEGFGEDEFVGRSLRIGAKAVVAVIDRDPRCKMVTLDPDTAEQNPEILRAINRGHDNKAGVYGAVLVEGVVHPGDEVTLLD